MLTTITEPESLVQPPPPTGAIATEARRPIAWRRIAAWSSLVAVPAIAGVAYGLAATRRRGVVLGGLTALGLGIARVELARFFVPEPTFERLGRIADLEIRRYPAMVEASCVVPDAELHGALDRGYGRLACFVYGANAASETIARTAPVMLAMADGHYVVSFVMPPGRSLSELPAPSHPGVELREVPERAVAVLRFRGRSTRDNIATHERVLLEQLIEAGLAARGSIMFAAFDSPATLPVLRRNELWIELV